MIKVEFRQDIATLRISSTIQSREKKKKLSQIQPRVN